MFLEMDCSLLLACGWRWSEMYCYPGSLESRKSLIPVTLQPSKCLFNVLHSMVSRR